ncbi:MAG: hypothetical protein DCC88_09685 [Spirobacillus cienkowskii]|jgi:hypothetical protein|uniref:Uncharacterized protein n=1 Tax=Spirobacillus cienkowskii TaxID=495820 RepID=A0A369KUX4_9BACT|nr:MAG: hypothetical protein DCC88_09685 [Spirobacillus cienkowskii]
MKKQFMKKVKWILTSAMVMTCTHIYALTAEEIKKGLKESYNSFKKLNSGKNATYTPSTKFVGNIDNQK